MKITSMEITNKEFKKVMRGYSQEEVDEFLDRVAEDYEILYKENSSLREKVSAIDERLEHYNKMESTIQNTLIMAQDASEHARENSQKESELILRTANDSAQKILDKAHYDVIAVTDEFEKTKQEFNKFRTKFRNFMQTHLDMFEDMEKDFVKNYNIGHDIVIREPESVLAGEDIKKNEADYFDIDENIDEIKNFFVKE